MSFVSRMHLSLAIALLGSASHAQDAAATQALQGLQPKMVEWRRDIHRHPELGTHEVRTAKLVADELRALGLQPRTGIASTGVTAILKGGKPGPRIAIRADMDALPVTEQTGFAVRIEDREHLSRSACRGDARLRSRCARGDAAGRGVGAGGGEERTVG